jgi:flagellar hook-associated protein FlgK
MTDLVSIAGSAVAAYQRALGTVANNIANVDSAGYTRQEAGLIENAPRSYGTSYLGTGVNVTGIKRLYDAFIENSLRNANTELGTQGPLVNYANRVVDIMGNEDVGLLSAFDQFFDSARQLATDSSSIILRAQFISKAEALASRFQGLNTQLNLVAQETAEALKSETDSLKSLSEQLALVNAQLGKTKIIERQPPAIMDQRDEILRQMAALAKLQVTERSNGQVVVSIGASSSGGEIVNGDTFRPVTAVMSPSSVGKVDLVIDAASPRAEAVFGFSGGSISGLMNFRSQLLEPSFTGLDNLARTLAIEANAIHREGIDLEGRNGVDLFRIDPQFSMVSNSGDTDVRYSASVLDLATYSANTLRLDYRANAGQINNVVLMGQFKVGDQITVNLNGAEKRLTISGALQTPVLINGGSTSTLSEGNDIELEEVLTQLRTFLEGGGDDGSDGGGVFGLQINVEEGTGTDLLVTSDVLGAFNLQVTTSSDGGRIDELITRGQWTLTDTVSGESTTGTKSVALNGIQLDLSGEARDGEILFLNIANSPSAGLRVAVDDPNRVAAAARFRVIENQFNPSKVNASLFETPEDFSADRGLWLDEVEGDTSNSNRLDKDNLALDNNILANEAVGFKGPKPTPIAVVPAGYRDTTLYLGDINGEDLHLQVVTRDGRHLLGQFFQPSEERIAQEKEQLGVDVLDVDQMAALYDEAGEDFLLQAKLAGVSFAGGSSYSHQYLNMAGDGAYRGMDLFYGVKAAVQDIAQLTVDHVYGEVASIPASITSTKLGITSGSLGETIYEEGDLHFNGVTMGALKIVADDNDVKRLQVTRTNDLGEELSLYLPISGSEFELEAEEEGVYAGKYLLTAGHIKAYFDAHHAEVNSAGVITTAIYASGGSWADLQRSSGMTITIETLEDDSEVLTFDRAISTAVDAPLLDSEIRIGLGETGQAAQLEALGFRTGVYISGMAKEDLYVFATGTASESFTLGATFTEGDRDAVESLRAEPFEVSFTSPTAFTIRDVLTDTIVAERIFDPVVGVVYRGVTLNLNAEPVAGDRFLVDGNQDGIGNNGTAVRLANLQNQRVVGNNSYTLAEAYGNLVGETGNVAFQAGIAKQALEVVKDQAVQARDKVSGVSLDQEAADLIRFQQAYQASAKVMQTANTLFDAILGIR